MNLPTGSDINVPAGKLKRKIYFLFTRQILKAMKLTLVFLTAFLLNASAKTVAQNVTLNVKNATLEKVFREIEHQTGYGFLFTGKMLRDASKVTLDVKNEPVAKVLEYVLSQQPLEYSIDNNTIVISRKENNFIATSNISVKNKILQVAIRGAVTDENGSPLEGVSVIEKGTTNGTSSNAQGDFSINVNNNNSLLVFSRVGYSPQTISLKGRTSINVRLLIDVTQNEEIVVASTGYQNISKERSTGSYDVVSANQLGKPSTNIGSRLVGQVAGVQATLDVDGNPSFQIRGQTSLYANSKPLIVVDGFAIQGDFNSINPNDVESVTILKDAAAASIWGARSANGVIVVVTKKARKGSSLKVDFNVFTRIGHKFDLDYVNPLATSAETVDYEKLLFSKNWTPLNNTGALSNYFYTYSQASTALNEFKQGFITEAAMNTTLDKLRTLSNKDQISKYLLSNPVNTQYNLNLSSGTEKMSNNLSLLFETNQSNYKETNNKRYMMNYRTTAHVFKWVDFNLSAMLQYNDFKNNGVSLGNIQSLSPYEMLLNPDNSFTNVSQYYWPAIERYVPVNNFPYSNWGYNPVQEINNRDLTTKQINARIQAGLTFHLMKGLTIDSRIQLEKFTSQNRGLYNDSTFYVRKLVNESTTWDPVTNITKQNLPSGNILTQSRSDVETYNWRNQLNFNRRFFSKHEINFAGGSEINNVLSRNYSNPTAYGYNDDKLTVGTFPNGPGGTFSPIKNWQGSNQTFGYTNGFSYNTDRYFSLYANLAYTFDRKYTLSGSYRTDASNLITDDPKYRYAPFYSIGGAWHATNEEFLSGISWLDDLNVRATYGYNGNVDKSTAFRPLLSLSATPNVYTNDYTASISSYGNPTLRWEKTGTWNLGADFSIFKGKLFGKVDVYNKSGKDLIATLSIPAANGTTTQKLNNAEMTNKGFEFTLGTIARISGNDITWRGNLNFSYNKNVITKLFVANYAAYSLYNGGTSAYVVGKDANTLWAFEYAGIREADNEPTVKGSGKDVYDFSAFTPGDGRDYLLDMGTKVAPYGLGFTSEFKIYDFDLSFIITGKFGHVFNRQSFNYPPLFTTRVLPNSSLSDVLNGDPNKIVPIPLNDDEQRFYFWDRFYPYMNYLVANASYLRMQEVNLTYTVPAAFLSRYHLKSDIRIYAQGNNLFTVLANKYGEDPEYLKGTVKPQPQFTFGARFSF